MSDDLQIRPVNPAGDSQNNQAGSSQGAGFQAAGNNSAASGMNFANSGSANTATNKRAFNLHSDVEESGIVQPKPEKYSIPKLAKEKYPELVELIKTTESMDDQEREYWFQILPIMNADQVDRLKNILATEKQQLAELDQEYEQELNRLNEKHLLEWKEFEAKEKSRAIREAEAASQEEEKQLEEDLLSKLDQL